MNIDRLHIEIEATNQCNTRCLHCPHEEISRPMGKMEWTTYQTIMSKVLASVENLSVEYAGMGEPLLNPSIYDFISFISDSAATSLTTNASALTAQNTERLVEAGLSQITVSFNGQDKVTYELMMGGLDFERAIKNLRRAVQISQDTGTSVAANVSITRQTQDKLVEIEEFLKQVGIEKVFFSKCHSRGGFLKGDLVCNTPMPPSDQYRCDIFTNTLFVAWTGEVLSCCHDLAGANVLGNLETGDLGQLLEKKTGIAARGVKFDICASCNDLYRFMNDQVPDRLQINEWVYNLYADQNNGQPEPATPLAAWISSLYVQEDQVSDLVAQLTSQINDRDKQIEKLQAERKQEVNALNEQIDAIHNSRTWRILDRFNQTRRRLLTSKD